MLPVKTQYVKVYPPVEMLALCEHTKLKGTKVRDLVDAKLISDDKIAECNLKQRELLNYITKKGE